MDFDFPITVALIIANCVVSFIAFNNADLMNKLIFHPPAVSQSNQWYRFITSGFIHKDVNHLLFNMLTLFFFGKTLEPGFTALGIGGGIGYLLFYIAAIAVSEIPTYIKHKNDDNYFSLGASGAISAVVFALVLFEPWGTVYLKFIIPIPFILYAVGYLFYSTYMAKKSGDGVGHSAHLWGALFGIAFFIVAYPNSIKIFMEQLAHPHFG
jgi:membrane associated rhomboid family serine protease